VHVDCSPEFRDLVEQFLDFISHEVRARELSFQAGDGDYIKEWKIEDYQLTVSIRQSD
jgi:isoleucyl-tRNA synthetase